MDKLEQLRQAGDRAGYLKEKARLEKEQFDQLQARHLKEVEAVKKEFPLGAVVPGIGCVTAIKDGCGTVRGWVQINIGDRQYTPQDLRRRVFEIKDSKRVRDYFNKLKFKSSGRVYLGQYDDILEDLITQMDLKIWGPDECFENNIDSFSDSFSYARDEAIKDGYTDEQADQKGQEAEDQARDEDANEYRGKVMECLNYLFSFCDCELTEKKGKYYLAPLTTWAAAADKMAELISGYGTFEYRSGKDLKNTLPAKTYSEAVISHIHWLKEGPKVYGGRAYDYMMR
jgi:hypothetical protein